MQEFHDGFHLPRVLHAVPPAPEVSLEGLTADPVLTGWSAESSAAGGFSLSGVLPLWPLAIQDLQDGEARAELKQELN